MAFSFLRFKPGSGSDPKLRTDENASNEHTGLVKLDLGAEGLNAVAAGSVPIRAFGAPNIAHNQVTVTTSATQIIAARPERRSVLIISLGGVDVFLGGAAVQTTNGIPLAGVVGANVTINTNGVVYGRVTSGTQVVAYLEEYD